MVMVSHPANTPGVTASEAAVAPLTAGPLTLRVLSAAEHEAVVDRLGASFLQVPRWAKVKPGWRSESLGWQNAAGELVGAALVLYRSVPKLNRHLAYVPEGPVLPWAAVAADPALWLDPLIAHVRAQRAFTLRIGPPVVHREWSTSTAKDGLADPQYSDFSELPADVEHAGAATVIGYLREHGWTKVGGEDGFTAGQPNYVVQIPLAGRSLDQMRANLNQLWRRNIIKAGKSGVKVRAGLGTDLAAFHELYVETAERDGFTPRPLAYFEGMWRAFNGDEPDSALKLFLAELDGEPLAAATVVTVGQHAWYGYGASTSRRREVRASNALQWHAMSDAQARGCAIYDLRGIGATLVDGGPLAGLLRFKLGTGGTTIEYVGEWDLALSPIWHKAFQTYLKRRS